jgi:hypothetical protein
VMMMEIFFPFFNFTGGQILRQNTEKKKLLTTTTIMVTYIH